MLPFILTLVLCTHTLSSAAEVEEQTFRALSFGKTTGDYIQFTPADMTPFRTSFTGCTWIKRQHDASYPIVLHFDPSDEIIMGSNGYYNYVSKHLFLTGKFPEKEVWFHYCLSWSAGGQQKVYINGEEVGSTSASSSNLRMGGDISIGINAQVSKNPSYIFGGQLYKLNLYSEVLSPSDIRQMSEAGMCSSVEQRHETRTLTWERILTEPRYGDVREFLPEECFFNLMAKLDKAASYRRAVQEELLDTRIRLNRTDDKLQQVMTTLNYTLERLEDTKIQLNNSLDQLEESESALLKNQDTLNSTEQKLTDILETLNNTRSELADTKIQLGEAQNRVEEREAKLNQTDDKLQQVMTTLNYTLETLEDTRIQLNNSLTELREVETALRECDARLNESLSGRDGGREAEEVSRWDVLYTSPYLNKLFTRQLYQQLVGSWGMMENFIGVNITVGFVKHFKEHHEEHQPLDEE
ncbi:hypothetical protein ACHWQZ_G002757 [Mnemiopsis leidyi]